MGQLFKGINHARCVEYAEKLAGPNGTPVIHVVNEYITSFMIDVSGTLDRQILCDQSMTTD